LQFKTNNIIKINNIPSIINREKIIILISNFIHKEGYGIKKIEYNFISKDKMLNINKKYLSHKTETDIITFDYTDFKKIEAEIYLCYSIIKKNALENRQSAENELVRVIIHGVLHCMGYNDKSKNKKKLMTDKENIFLKLFHVKHSNHV
jgi:rRNA maturation RNase YbeY